MANLRLFGLVMIVTTMLLGLAAVATQTTTIRFGLPSALAGNEIVQQFPVDDGDTPIHFIRVPIAYPLIAAIVVGSLMWFLPGAMRAGTVPPKNSVRRKRPRRRR